LCAWIVNGADQASPACHLYPANSSRDHITPISVERICSVWLIYEKERVNYNRFLKDRQIFILRVQNRAIYVADGVRPLEGERDS